MHIGEKLVKDCILKAYDNGYKVLQFNAVVATNVHARHLYERVGFKQLGIIPNGFRLKNGKYEEGVTFEQIVELYLFNANFRQVTFAEIEKIEVNVLSLIHI